MDVNAWNTSNATEEVVPSIRMKFQLYFPGRHLSTLSNLCTMRALQSDGRRRRCCWYRGCRVVVLLAKSNYLFAACLSCFTRIILILVFCQNFTMPMVLVLVLVGIGVGYNAYPDDVDDIFSVFLWTVFALECRGFGLWREAFVPQDMKLQRKSLYKDR